VYKGSKLVNAIQWAVGLELLLLIDDPWRVFLTTDHPNGACFWRYPELIRLLMNADYRRECLSKLPSKLLERVVLKDLDREYTLSEIAVITSAGPARALGLSQKGHLGPGADADVTIYQEKPDGDLIFEYPRYVIKGGEIAVEEGEIRSVMKGRQYIVQPSFDEQIEEYLRPLFERVYTMAFDNYPVSMDRIPRPDIQPCK
jgi:formylmethanofuran dehydrogenase subunit A